MRPALAGDGAPGEQTSALFAVFRDWRYSLGYRVKTYNGTRSGEAPKTMAIQINGVHFRENHGVLYASRTGSDTIHEWNQVATLPVADFKELERHFSFINAQFRLATIEGSNPPSGQMYVLLPPSCTYSGPEVREIQASPQPFRFTLFYVAVTENSASDA